MGFPNFAQDYWTNVGNWSLHPDIESIEIDEIFAMGAAGLRNSGSNGRVEWRIVDVQPEEL